MISNRPEPEDDFFDGDPLLTSEITVKGLKTLFGFSIDLEQLTKVRISKLYFKMKCCGRVVVYKRNKARNQQFEVEAKEPVKPGF